MAILWAPNDPFDLSIHAIKIDMGRVMEVWLSCYLVLLSVDSDVNYISIRGVSIITQTCHPDAPVSTLYNIKHLSLLTQFLIN